MKDPESDQGLTDETAAAHEAKNPPTLFFFSTPVVRSISTYRSPDPQANYSPHRDCMNHRHDQLIHVSVLRPLSPGH